jgi:hypothetical protein
MFEQQYKRANDRIHPRKDLLKEMEAKWAEEQAHQEEEESKVVAFPAWAKYVGMAAGVLLCVGLGMGSVLLYSRSRGMQSKSASAAAEAPQMAESMVAMEEAKIVTATTADTAVNETEAQGAAPAEAMLAASPYEAPKGMHRAADEAEVEDALHYGFADRGEAGDSVEAEMDVPQAKAAAKAVAADYPVGQILTRDELMVVFLPTTDQVRVVQYANRRVNLVFSLGLRERGAKVEQLFWIGSEMLAVREHAGDTELMRFDVADWKAPRHLRDLTQSGSFLCAGETGGKVFVLSLTKVAEEEPLPWVDGTRMDFDQVLLDAERPGDIFTVITVCDPQGGDGFAAQTALLTKARGAIIEMDRLLLWAG